MKRMIDTGTWDDPWFADLEPDTKLVFLYLLTNRRSTAAGAFEITVRAMAFETGLDQARIEAALHTLESRVQWWPEHRIIWVRNFLKHQAANENFWKSAKASVAEFPADVQVAIGSVYPSLFDDRIPLPMPTGTDTPPDGYPTGTDTHSLVIDIEKGSSSSSEGKGSGVGAANAAAPKPAPKRATQVPDDFAVTERLEQWGAAQEPPFAVSAMRVEVPQFVDYYQAKGETRKDWDASFRTWMRNSRKWQRDKPAPSGGKSGSGMSITDLLASIDEDEHGQQTTRNRDKESVSDSASGVAKSGTRPDDNFIVFEGVQEHGLRVIARSRS